MVETPTGPAIQEIDNHLRARRLARGLSQGQLAGQAGVTRQAIYAIETNEYLPSTAVALRLAEALGCRVEDLFSLVGSGEIVEGDLVAGSAGGRREAPPHPVGCRVKVARVGERLVVRPIAGLGDLLTFTVGADGLLLGPARPIRAGGSRVRVRLLRDRRAVEEDLVVAGCDPAIFLIGEHLRRQRDRTAVVGWTMGSAAALRALQRGDVHVAGIHVRDARSGEWNLPYLRRHLRQQEAKVVTFASWTEGLMVRRGNPKRVRTVEDLARQDVTIVNREEGAGARLLLDERLEAAGIGAGHIKGYERRAASHLEVARLIAEGLADAGVGVEAAARSAGLDFVPLQSERYDLVIPAEIYRAHPHLDKMLGTLVSRPFRAELEALGGYDTTETGNEHALRGSL